MPLVDVSHGPAVTPEQLSRLARSLPHVVSLAVECPEEPYDHALEPGDVEIRFRARGEYDVSGLDLVVEVRSKWFASRADNRQERVDRIRDAVVDLVAVPTVGVYLSLPVAAWSQTD